MEDRITLAEAFEELAGYGPAFWCGVAAGIATFVIEIILCKRGILFAGDDRKIALAKQRGHMLTAKRTQLRFRDREPGGHEDEPRLHRRLRVYGERDHTHQAGIVHQREATDHHHAVLRQKPRQGVLGVRHGKNPLQVLLYIVPVLVVYVVATALGFEP